MAVNTVLAKMAVKIAADTAEFKGALAKTQGELKGFQANIGKIAAGIGIAFGIKEIAGFALEMGKLAGEAEGVERAFNKLPNSKRLMNDLKEATSGTVSELALMKRTVQAANFGISLEALPKLLEFASVRAQQTGQSVDYLVDSIVTGIGRKSPLILDNLGISAVALKEKLGGVSLAAADVGQIADAVGKIAGDSLQEMGSMSENTATKLQRLSASWEDLRVEIGKAVNDSGVIGWLADMGVAFVDMYKLAKSDPVMERFAEQTAKAVDEFRKFNKEAQANAINQVVADIQYYQKELNQSNLFLKTFSENLDKGADAALRLASAQTGINFKSVGEGLEFVKMLTSDINNQEKAVISLKDQYKQMLDVFNAPPPPPPPPIPPGLLESLQEKLKAFEEQKKKSFSTSEVAMLNDKIKDLRSEIDLLNASTANTSGYFKQLEKGIQPEIKDFSLPEPKSPFSNMSDVKSPDIGADAIVEQFERIGYARQADIDQAILWNDIQNEQFENTKSAALEYGDAIGSALGNAIAGQESAANVLKKISASIIQTFLKQALAGIIASATKSGGPPPVVLGLAAAGVAAISAMFSKLGASGGGGGRSMASSASRSAQRQTGTLTNTGREITMSGEFVIAGDDLRYIINRNDQKNERRRG